AETGSATRHGYGVADVAAIYLELHHAVHGDRGPGDGADVGGEGHVLTLDGWIARGGNCYGNVHRIYSLLKRSGAGAEVAVAAIHGRDRARASRKGGESEAGRSIGNLHRIPGIYAIHLELHHAAWRVRSLVVRHCSGKRNQVAERRRIRRRLERRDRG